MSETCQRFRIEEKYQPNSLLSNTSTQTQRQKLRSRLNLICLFYFNSEEHLAISMHQKNQEEKISV